MKEKKLRPIKIRAVLFWIIIWHISSMIFAKSILFPSPLEVFISLISLFRSMFFWKAVCFSVLRIIGGFILGLIFGVLFSILSFKWKSIGDILEPIVSVIKAVPVASFIILALVWLDSKSITIFIVFLMVFPIIYVNVLGGLMSTDKKLLEMSDVFSVPFLRRLRGIYIPGVLPHLRNAMSVSLGLCWKAGTAAEVIAIPRGSLGELLYSAKIYFLTSELFAVTVTILLLSFFFERLILSIVDILLQRTGVI